jgi:5-methylcytosine-specific restriction endonuclease McrA
MTHYRLTAARVLCRFPQAIEPLRQGQLCMTTLASLAPVLTGQNCDEVLAEAMGKPKVEVLRIKARLAPKPLPNDAVKRNPAKSSPGGGSPVPAQVEAALPAVRTEVLTESLTRRHMTTDREFEDLLTQARSALSHKLPGASELEILKAGLREIVRQHEKRKGIVQRPRKPAPRTEPAKGDDAIPAQVKREVWLRDQGCCQWPTSEGTICGSRTRIEFHHRLDRGKGGRHTVSNLMLVCSVHNAYAADQVWGKAFMDRFHRGGSRDAEQDDCAHP